MSELFKVLGPKAESIHGGTGSWKLPKGKRPGVWMPRIEEVKCCNSGYHLVELYSLPEWLKADCTIYVAEGRGNEHSDGSGKTAYGQARLIHQVHISECDLRLFAADCAEHVLPIFLKVCPDDDRPANAIKAARQFARGEIDSKARSAAYSAAQDAAWSAAQDAARSAAGSAAGSAAYAAAATTAAAAAGVAAQVAEKQWQSETLKGYLT